MVDQNSQNNKNSDDLDDIDAQFTVDAADTGADVPGLTKLLNRKSLNLSTPTPAADKPSRAPTPASMAEVDAVNEGATKLDLFTPRLKEAGSSHPQATSSIEFTNPHQAKASQGLPDIVLSDPEVYEMPAELDTPQAASAPVASSPTRTVAAPPPAPPARTRTISAPPAAAPVAVQRAVRRADRKAPAALLPWDLNSLRNGNDPLGKGLAQLLETCAEISLFLAVTAAPASVVPNFTATAVASSARASREAIQQKARVWTGLRWDPKVVPELWNAFVRVGYAELSPPTASTNAQSTRNVVRTAFGVESGEFLLLVRVGPAQTCRGVLALISNQSILPQLNGVIALLSAPMPGPAKKSA